MILSSPILGCLDKDYPAFDVVVRSSASLERNISDLAFPNSLSADNKLAVSKIIVEAVKKIGFSLALISELDSWFRLNLAERMLYSRQFLLDESNYVALSNDLPAWIIINDANHVSINASLSGLDTINLWKMLSALDDKLCIALEDKKWAFDADIGYLMSDAHFCGTGFNAKLTIHVPALVQSGLVESAFKRIMEAGFIVSGLYSMQVASSGSLFDIILPKPYRENELESIGRLEIAIKTISDYERRIREMMLSQSSWDILDLVGRAYGRAIGIRLVSRDEASDIISGLRLGLACGILEGVDLATVTEMWFQLNIRAEEHGKLPIEEVFHERRPESAWRADKLRALSSNIRFNERYENV